jgi:hypothetical protein
MTEKSDRWLVSVCGLNCAKCDIYQAGHGNEKLREEMVEWFRKERNETVKPEQIRCEGCRGSLEVHWSPDCRIMLCAEKKALQYCFQCEDFPCKILEEFGSDGISHHKRTFGNLKRMKKSDLKDGLQSKRKEGRAYSAPREDSL